MRCHFIPKMIINVLFSGQFYGSRNGGPQRLLNTTVLRPDPYFWGSKFVSALEDWAFFFGEAFVSAAVPLEGVKWQICPTIQVQQPCNMIDPQKTSKSPMNLIKSPGNDLIKRNGTPNKVKMP